MLNADDGEQNHNIDKNALYDKALERQIISSLLTLLDKDANTPWLQENSKKSLELAMLYDNVALLDKLIANTDITVDDTVDDCGALIFWAILSEKKRIFDYLIKNHSDINAKNDAGETPLHAACFVEDTTYLETLLNQKNINFNPRDNRKGQTPFQLVCHSNNLSAMTLFLGHDNVDNQVIIRDGNLDEDAISNLLELIYAKDNSPLLKILISNNILEVNFKFTEGSTLLMWAAKDKKINLVMQLLIYPGIDVNIENNQQRSAFYYAYTSKSKEVVVRLMAHPNIDIIKCLKACISASGLEFTNEKHHEDIAKIINAQIAPLSVPKILSLFKAIGIGQKHQRGTDPDLAQLRYRKKKLSSLFHYNEFWYRETNDSTLIALACYRHVIAILDTHSLYQADEYNKLRDFFNLRVGRDKNPEECAGYLEWFENNIQHAAGNIPQL